MRIPSLYPLYIPYKTQHELLTRTQCLLEACCYSFTAQWMPDLLDQWQWDCPQAIELNNWTFIVAKQMHKLPSHCFGDLDTDKNPMSLASVLTSVNELRHTAVHRLRTTAKGILEMIRSATRFAGALGDLSCQQQLDELHGRLDGKIRALELNKNFLESRLEKEMHDLARQREELDKKERNAVSTMRKEDKDYGWLIGTLLSQDVNEILDKRTVDGPNLPEGEQNVGAATEDEREQAPAADSEVFLNASLGSLDGAEPGANQDLGRDQPQPSTPDNSLHHAQLRRPSSASPQGEACYANKHQGERALGDQPDDMSPDLKTFPPPLDPNMLPVDLNQLREDLCPVSPLMEPMSS